jgi:hypothetical protein
VAEVQLEGVVEHGKRLAVSGILQIVLGVREDRQHEAQIMGALGEDYTNRCLGAETGGVDPAYLTYIKPALLSPEK